MKKQANNTDKRVRYTYSQRLLLRHLGSHQYNLIVRRVGSLKSSLHQGDWVALDKDEWIRAWNEQDYVTKVSKVDDAFVSSERTVFIVDHAETTRAEIV